ncbi:hypothetical protein RFI_31868 [Reticulomyxa filosa]|uniref:Uncharacterized protein n=1 Tax=Reticulomyxa filosa TaxID=46433 RepID=X6LVY2_RETFI|nr:hypothetical protein RFI_31868 [Reticulomyxa filosa]|eukprot:ETO05526.1 hypothetical protein RFI_31868 [Reticulomyxa filosa]
MESEIEKKDLEISTKQKKLDEMFLRLQDVESRFQAISEENGRLKSKAANLQNNLMKWNTNFNEFFFCIEIKLLAFVKITVCMNILKFDAIILLQSNNKIFAGETQKVALDRETVGVDIFAAVYMYTTSVSDQKTWILKAKWHDEKITLTFETATCRRLKNYLHMHMIKKTKEFHDEMKEMSDPSSPK